jgi:hypothetical protein
VAASVPSDTVSQFVRDLIRDDRSNARGICSAWILSVLAALQQSNVLTSIAPSSTSFIAPVAVDFVASADSSPASILTGSSSSVGGEHSGSQMQNEPLLGVDRSSSSVPKNALGSALSDVEHSIVSLRPVFTVIFDLRVAILPDALSKSVEYVSQLLDSVHEEAKRIRATPNDDAHPRLIASLASLESIMVYLQSMYAVSFSESMYLLITERQLNDF